MDFDEALGIAERLACRAPLDACPDWPAREARAFPGVAVPVIVADGGGTLCVCEATWGFPVAWKKGLVFNTRLETAVGPRPGMWAGPIECGRCLVPAFGFVETHASETEPNPRTGRPVRGRYRFGFEGGEPMLLAGVCGEMPGECAVAERAAGVDVMSNAAPDVADGIVPRLSDAGASQTGLLRLSLVTTSPNAQVSPVHNRMPLALRDFEALAWLGDDFTRLADRSNAALSVNPLEVAAASRPDETSRRSSGAGPSGSPSCSAQLSLF